MDEKPARMLHSPARSIGLFKRYQVFSIVGDLLDVDVSRDVWLRYFPRFRPIQDSGQFATCKFTISKYAGSTGEVDGVKGW